MGGNASIGLGTADRHSLRDMKCLEADDRPTDDTNTPRVRKGRHYTLVHIFAKY